jgi:putative hydrolase of the HAD superfamily
MIKAIIFDLNGIFIQSPKLSDRFRDEFKVSTDTFVPVLKEIMAKVRMPNTGDCFEYWKPYLKEWNLDLTKEEFFNFWFKAEKEQPELIDIAKRIKEKGIKIFILSNNFRERADYYKENFPFLDIFNKVYYSWRTGYVKPDPRAFNNLLLEQDLKAEECIYFDNSEENVETANNVGIRSYLFKDINTLREGLNNE